MEGKPSEDKARNEGRTGNGSEGQVREVTETEGKVGTGRLLA